MRCHWVDEKLSCCRIDPSVRSRLRPLANDPVTQVPGATVTTGRGGCRKTWPVCPSPRAAHPSQSEIVQRKPRMTGPPETSEASPARPKGTARGARNLMVKMESEEVSTQSREDHQADNRKAP